MGHEIEKLIQRHASAYVARGSALSDSIVAECKASRQALLDAYEAAESTTRGWELAYQRLLKRRQQEGTAGNPINMDESRERLAGET